MIHAENCEKLSKFIEIAAKKLSVLFSETRCIYTVSTKKTKPENF